MIEQLEFEFEIPAEIAEPVKRAFLTDKIIQPDYFLYRIDDRGSRWYVKVDDAFEYPAAPSVTTIIGKVSRRSDGLLKWYCDLGWQAAHEVMTEKAHYGTFMHLVFANMLCGLTVSTADDWLLGFIEAYCQQKEIEIDSVNSRQWLGKIKKDIIGFAHWVKDYQVRPIAVECAVWAGRYAGVIDLVCDIIMYENGKPETAKKKLKRVETKLENRNRRRWAKKWVLPVKPKGTKPLKVPEKPSRYRIAIDFKSRRGAGIFEDWDVQLDAYANAWNKQHPEFSVSKKFIYHPTDFDLPLAALGKPYSFTERTVDKRKKWAHYLGLFFEDDNNKIRDSTRVAPVEINLTEDLPEFIETVNPLQRLIDSIDEQRKVDEVIDGQV